MVLIRRRKRLLLVILAIISTIIISPSFTQPFGITWRKALLSAPRLVPNAVLYYTSREGPHPVIINIPSRGTHSIPLYVFIPSSPDPTNGDSQKESLKLPVLVDFHGGGFIFGSCLEQAPFCAKMSRELNAVSISVDYRLGPAAQFPAAIHDAEDVINAILDPQNPGYQELRTSINKVQRRSSRPEIELDASRIAVSGFSSGGNLALNLGLSIPALEGEGEWLSPFPRGFGRDIPLLLFYPSLDCRQLPSERPRPQGMEEKKKNGLLSILKLETELMPTYLPRKKAGHYRASPGLANLRNGGLHENAKMLLVLPELDTLAAQSVVWIQEVGNEGRIEDLTVERVGGVVHGWTQFPDLWLTEEHRRLKMDVFNKTREFIKKSWISGE